jgi:hypothetical protein
MITKLQSMRLCQNALSVNNVKLPFLQYNHPSIAYDIGLSTYTPRTLSSRVCSDEPPLISGVAGQWVHVGCCGCLVAGHRLTL